MNSIQMNINQMSMRQTSEQSERSHMNINHKELKF